MKKKTPKTYTTYIFAMVASSLFIGLFFGNDIIDRYTSQREKTADNSNIISYVPTKCDLSLPVPNTVKQYEGQEYSWKFSEKLLQPEAFFPLDENQEQVQVASLLFKGTEETRDLSSALIFCIDNNEDYSLEEYVSLVKVNKKYPATVNNKVSLGRAELPFQSITLSNVQGSEGEFDESSIIGLSENNEKLLYMIFFQGDPNVPFAPELNEDISLIQRNIEYR